MSKPRVGQNGKTESRERKRASVMPTRQNDKTAKRKTAEADRTTILRFPMLAYGEGATPSITSFPDRVGTNGVLTEGPQIPYMLQYIVCVQCAYIATCCRMLPYVAICCHMLPTCSHGSRLHMEMYALLRRPRLSSPRLEAVNTVVFLLIILDSSIESLDIS